MEVQPAAGQRRFSKITQAQICFEKPADLFRESSQARLPQGGCLRQPRATEDPGTEDQPSPRELGTVASALPESFERHQFQEGAFSPELTVPLIGKPRSSQMAPSEAGTVEYASRASSSDLAAELSASKPHQRVRRRRLHDPVPQYNFKAGEAEMVKYFRVLEFGEYQRQLEHWMPLITKIHRLHANLMTDLPRDHPARTIVMALEQRLFGPLRNVTQKQASEVSMEDVRLMKKLALNIPHYLAGFRDFLDAAKRQAGSREEFYNIVRADYMNFNHAFGPHQSTPAAVAA